MSPTQLARLAMVLGALLLLWGAASLARRGSRGPSESDRFALASVPRDSVDSIVVLRAADTARLGRVDSATWTVNGHRASRSAVDDILAALSDTARRTELVGGRPASHAGFGVDSTKGTRVRIVQGDSTVEVIQGNRGPGLEGGYFRLAGDSPVYLLRGNLAEALERTSDELRDKRIASVAADSVARIEVSRGRRSYALRHSGAAWTLAPGGAADSVAVAELLSSFAQVEAAGFATPAQADSAQLARPDRRVALFRKDGSALLTLAFDSTATGFWVRAGEDSTVYRMDTWSADRLTPADTTLRAKPAAS